MVELRDILKQVGVTALYVTHDQTEAFAIADRVVVMKAGRIEQIGPPEKIYRYPATPFVAYFLGLTNLAEGQVIESGRVASAWGELAASTDHHHPGDRVSVLIRPESATLGPVGRPSPAKTGQSTTLCGQLLTRSFRGGRYRVKVQPEVGPPLSFELTTAAALAAAPGESIWLKLDPAGVVLLPAPAARSSSIDIVSKPT